jgi:hypothetical protein
MPLRRFINSFLVALVATGGLWAQDGHGGVVAAGAGQFQISGTLVDLKTGQPIPRARVAVTPVTQRDDYTTMVTGPEGAFVFTGLTPGKYTLTAQARGYNIRSFNQHEHFSSSIAVGPDLDSTHLVFQMPPECGISGVVADEAGEPVRNAQVTLYLAGRAYDDAPVTLTRTSTTTTNDEGAYRFGHLSPGRYILAAKAHPWYAQHWQNRAGARAQDLATIRLLDVTYPVTFNGGITDAHATTPILLSDGDQAAADIALQSVPALHLPLNAAIGVSDPRVQVSLEEHVLDGPPIQGGMYINSGKDGREIGGIAPGRYTLRMTGGFTKESVSREIEVRPSGIVEVQADDDVLISAEVRFGSASPGPATLRLLDKNLKEASSAGIGSDGKVAFPSGVAPGTYELALASASGIYLKSFAALGASATGRTIHVRRGAPVKLTVSAALGEGTVSGIALLEGKPHAGAMIVLAPADPDNNHVLFRRDQSNTDGSFILRNVVPGAYTVLATDDWEMDWMNADVLKRYLSHGVAVQVQPDGKYDVKAAVQRPAE